jgi:H+/Cl- antiporter ClcA
MVEAIHAVVRRLYRLGVFVKALGTTILAAYIAVLMAALLFGPLLLLHGYREWWLVIFYAGAVLASIAGIAGSLGRRNSVPHH